MPCVLAAAGTEQLSQQHLEFRLLPRGDVANDDAQAEVVVVDCRQPGESSLDQERRAVLAHTIPDTR